MCQSSHHLASLGFYRERLADEVVGWGGAFALEGVCSFPDVHVASACLQKALRRGDGQYAFDAARYLYEADEARLWRRLAICAFEDFGLVDLGLTARVVVAATSSGLRVRLGVARVLQHLIARLSASVKDRRLDEISALVDGVEQDKERLRVLERAPLGAILAPLVHEASRIIGRCEQKVPGRSWKRLSIAACERSLAGMAQKGLVDEGLYQLVDAGLRVSKCHLPLLLPLAIEATDQAGGLGEVVDDCLPPAPFVGAVPAYALDGFTRIGRRMLELLPKRAPDIAALLRDVPPRERFSALHHLLFYAEGARLSPSVGDPLYVALKTEAMASGMRLPLERVKDALERIEAAFPQIHALRAELVARAIPPNLKEIET